MPRWSDPTYQARRSPAIAFVNAAGRLLGRVGFSPASFDRDRLIEIACRRTGLDDYGDDDWREPLGTLLGSLASESNLTPIGRVVAHEHVARLLARRLRLQDERRRSPDVAAERIRPTYT